MGPEWGSSQSGVLWNLLLSCTLLWSSSCSHDFCRKSAEHFLSLSVHQLSSVPFCMYITICTFRFISSLRKSARGGGGLPATRLLFPVTAQRSLPVISATRTQTHPGQSVHHGNETWLGVPKSTSAKFWLKLLILHQCNWLKITVSQNLDLPIILDTIMLKVSLSFDLSHG